MSGHYDERPERGPPRYDDRPSRYDGYERERGGAGYYEQYAAPRDSRDYGRSSGREYYAGDYDRGRGGGAGYSEPPRGGGYYADPYPPRDYGSRGYEERGRGGGGGGGGGGGVRRVYVGEIPRDLRRPELEDEFRRCGRVVGVNIHTDTNSPYAFVEFESARDADDAVRRFNEQRVFGKRIKVQLATGKQKERVPGAGASGTAKRTDFRVLVLGVPSTVQWQDLKDFGRPVRSLWAAALPFACSLRTALCHVCSFTPPYPLLARENLPPPPPSPHRPAR